MIKIENVEIAGWEPAIRGMRNPKNSWARIDSDYCSLGHCDECPMFYPDDGEDRSRCQVSESIDDYPEYVVGPNDHGLMMNLANGGPVHAKYRRMITVYVDITAPLYWWKEFDTYKVGTVANSCSTMHMIHVNEFTLEDFSIERLEPLAYGVMQSVVEILEYYRKAYNAAKNGDPESSYNKDDMKACFNNMIQLLPSSYNQKRTIMLNYEVLAGMYTWRKNHKLDEWKEFCKWIESLPYSEIITGEKNELRN